ncbi:hypothetical protein [Hoeflea sp.]|nr:hypothetical protein [Hoeflea sp.]
MTTRKVFQQGRLKWARIGERLADLWALCRIFVRTRFAIILD